MTLKLTVEQALQEATSALNDGKFKEAETNYKKVIELKPEFAEAYRSRLEPWIQEYGYSS